MKQRDLRKIAFDEDGELDFKHITTYEVNSRKFFENGSGVVNPTDTRNMAKSHCLEAVLRLDYLCKHPQHLQSRSEKWFDQVFNAHSMESILLNLLRENDKPEFIRDFRHDFKTVELARMYFEVSMMLLKSNTKESRILHSDIERISERYKEIAKTTLENEAYKQHGNELERAFTIKDEELEKINLEKTREEFSEHFMSKEYRDGHKEAYRLRNKEQEFRYRYIVKNNYKDLSKKQLKIVNGYKTNIQIQIDQILSKLRKKEHVFREKITAIKNNLNKKYDSHKTHYCKTNFLHEFSKDMQKKGFDIPKDRLKEIKEENNRDYNEINPSILMSVETRTLDTDELD